MVFPDNTHLLFMVFKIALLIALERRKGFLFLVGKYFEVVLIYENDFQETILYIRMTKGRWRILIDIHNGFQS